MSREDQRSRTPSPTHSFRSTPSPENPEDHPLGGAGRTFAQLLVDQLGFSDDTNISLTEPKRVNFELKPFLRRGTGLTRFNLPPDPSQQPSRVKRSQSQPRLSDVRSRLSHETQSFANKKTPPKRSVSKSPQMNKRKSLVYPLSPSNKIKLKSPQKSSQIVKSKDTPQKVSSQPAKCQPSLQDSVENSFKEKLRIKKKNNELEQDIQDFALIEMMEDVTNQSSFCRNFYRLDFYRPRKIYLA